MNLMANIHIIPFQFVKNSYFTFCKVVRLHDLGEVRKFYRTLVTLLANLSKTLHINFYQNW